MVGAVNRAAQENTVVVCAAGGLPGELHKLWRAAKPNGYHMEYGFSCMGYEIAGGLGDQDGAAPEREVFVMVGDGSYMMMNSELADLGHARREACHDRATTIGAMAASIGCRAPAAGPTSTT